MLFYMMERLKRVTKADKIVVLTSTLPQDDPIAEFCKKQGYACFRGSEDDVLNRYYKAAVDSKPIPDAIVRVTGDCPIIDPVVIDEIIDIFLKENTKLDYVSNTLKRTYPRGLDAEVFSFTALEKAFHDAKDPSEREHVTLHMYRNPKNFRLRNLSSPENLSQYRWTVDTQEDFKLIKLIFENLYPHNPQFNLQDILELMRKHPEWININAEVKQKEV